jgi:DNA-binding GntR family transcriptional regulator
MTRPAQTSESLRPEEGVFEELKRAILLGRLRPRERLLEADLAERFKVGRHVVRGALELLERHGLVNRRVNRGAIVRDYEPEEIDELYDMRGLLHAAAVERIALPVSGTLIFELESINKSYEANLEARSLAAVVDANDKFHRTLFAACGNRFLTAAIEEFWLKTAAIHCYAIADPILAAQSLREHEIMIDALKASDRERLLRVCIDHMYPALEAYRRRNSPW